MNKKDIKYRQGRSKAQVETNEKVAFTALIIIICIFAGTLTGLGINMLFF